MTDPTTTRLPEGLPAEVTKSLVSLWTRYAGKAPANARTEVRGNVVTCTLVDAVGDFNGSMIASQTGGTVRGEGKLTQAAYKGGMRPLRVSGAAKIAQGLTTFEEVLKSAPLP